MGGVVGKTFHHIMPTVVTEPGAFVLALSADCPIVVVQTHKTERSDGYLADVFYLPGSDNPHAVIESGRLLNQHTQVCRYDRQSVSSS